MQARCRGFLCGKAHGLYKSMDEGGQEAHPIPGLINKLNLSQRSRIYLDMTKRSLEDEKQEALDAIVYGADTKDPQPRM